jgi:hypothetical protein
MLSELQWGPRESKNLVEASKNQPYASDESQNVTAERIRDGIFEISAETDRMGGEKSVSAA